MLEYRTIEYGSPLYRASLALRETVLRHPLGLSIRPEDVADDGTHIHFAAVADGKPIACLIAAPLDANRAKLRQMAVSSAYRGKGIGTALLDFVETWLATQQFQQTTLHARTEARRFYEASGYCAQGDYFTEIGIPHIAMHKTL